MEKEFKKAFSDVKKLIRVKDENQNKMLTDFKKHHDEISKQYWRLVQTHEKVLQGTDAKGGLVACVQRLKEAIKTNRQLIWFCFTLIVGAVVVLFRGQIFKILGG